jgi:predicted HTH transcriptional regulator
MPVNQRLADIFMQLHISEQSGRGVPKIVAAYGKKHLISVKIQLW